MGNDVSSFYKEAYIKNIDEIEARFEEIKTVSAYVETLLFKKFGNELFILRCAKERLQTSIISYFYDIHRYKHFHGMLDFEVDKSDIIKKNRINFPKIYAFTIKWFVKAMPYYIFIHDSEREKLNEEKQEKLIELGNFINEIIILYWIKISYEANYNEILLIPDESKLAYNLKYRNISTGMLEAYFASFMHTET